MADAKVKPKKAQKKTRVDLLEALGLASEAELVRYLPHDFLDYTNPVTDFMEALDRGRCCLRVRWLSRQVDLRARPMNMKAVLEDAASRTATIWFFGGGLFALKDTPPGTEVFISGSIETWGGGLTVKNGEILPRGHAGAVVPVYRGKGGWPSQEIASRVANAFELHGASALLTALQAAGTAIDVADRDQCQALLAKLHAPKSMQDAKVALKQARKLAAREVIRQAQAMEPGPVPESGIDIPWELITELVGALPFELTRDQKLALRDVVQDLRSDRPMNRLLSADVGHGKTVVFGVAAAACFLMGRRVGILAPNLLLVDQTARQIAGWFPDIPVLAVTGGRRKSVEPAGILIGTTALVHQARKTGWIPDLLVVDEQQKLSNAQRTELLAPYTNLLESTATCIPRTAALITHGGMSVSIIRESPVAKDITTRVVRKENARAMFDYLGRVIEQGRAQVAVIYPRVSDRADGMKSVVAAAEVWEKRFPGVVGVLHGRMTDSEKASVMERMHAGEHRILVCSTILEVGVDLKELRGLVVARADHYGLSQLHQLRGRVARTGGSGFCFLYLPEDVPADTLARLQFMEQISDGFELSEKDMEERGFGDLAADSTSQHGASETVFYGLRLMPVDIREAERTGSEIR